MPDVKSTKKTRTRKRAADPDLWHLSRDATEARLTGFEFSLERVLDDYLALYERL